MCKKIKVDSYVNIEKKRKLTTPQNLFLIALRKKFFDILMCVIRQVSFTKLSEEDLQETSIKILFFA